MNRRMFCSQLLVHYSKLNCPGVETGRQATLRWWCPKGCAGSNPVLGTEFDLRQFFSELPFLFSSKSFVSRGISANKLLTLMVRTVSFFLLYRMPLGHTKY